jgi:hypothetical protein
MAKKKGIKAQQKKKAFPAKTILKKTNGKKVVLKKPTGKKVIAKKTAVKSSAAKKVVGKKAVAKKTAVKKTTTKSTVVKKAPAKKIVFKKAIPLKKAVVVKARPKAKASKSSLPAAVNPVQETVDKPANIHSVNMIANAAAIEKNEAVQTEDPVKTFDKNAFAKATKKGDPHSKLYLNSNGKGSIRPSGKKPLWKK